MSDDTSRRPRAGAGSGRELVFTAIAFFTASLTSAQDAPEEGIRQAPSALQGGGNDFSGGVNLQFPLNPVNDILNIYERLINKPLVKDSSIFEGPQVSLVTPAMVSKDEAVRLIEAALLVNGYVIVGEEGGDSVTVLLGGQRQGMAGKTLY
ncbi:MAG: hypothetical protein AAGA96_15115, partial [Verrucomicrobiota bacterium]